MKGIVFSFFAIIYYTSAEINIEGSKVYNVWPLTTKDQSIINNLVTIIPGIDVWQKSFPNKREARILVPENGLKMFELILDLNEIRYEVSIEDVEQLAKNEIAENERARSRRGNEKISFTSYNRHKEMNDYLDSLANKYPKTVVVETANITPEGREIKFIKISNDKWEDSKKPVIVVEAGIHAREWISPSVALYIISKLVDNITESDVVDKLDWLIFPSINPDGYEYSHTRERLWRKTRTVRQGFVCIGVDGNRNFDMKWMYAGSSNNTCSDTYAGPIAFSEVETQSVRDQVLKNKGRGKLYVSVHSFGSYVLYPYGYDGSLPANHDELNSLGLEFAEAIKAVKEPEAKDYVVGNSFSVLYATSGGSDDYAMAVGGFPLSFTVELPGYSTGFDLPPSKIMQVVTETWGGFLVFARHVIKNYS